MDTTRKIQVALVGVVLIVAIIIVIYYLGSSTAQAPVTLPPVTVQPTPVQPTPVQPTPVQPTPVQPTPIPIVSDFAKCTPCSSPGNFACPGSVIKSTEWYNGQNSLLSNYRLAAYDPVTPPITIDGKGYYFRQLGGCIEPDINKCKQCSPGYFACPGSVIKSSEWYNGQNSMISEYRLAAYDPVTPPITIDGKGYYFRQLGNTC